MLLLVPLGLLALCDLPLLGLLFHVWQASGVLLSRRLRRLHRLGEELLVLLVELLNSLGFLGRLFLVINTHIKHNASSLNSQIGGPTKAMTTKNDTAHKAMTCQVTWTCR